jgi:hypothetical protein
MAAVSNGASALLDALELGDAAELPAVLEEDDELSESEEHAVATSAADSSTASAAGLARLGPCRRVARGTVSSGDMIFLLEW